MKRKRKPSPTDEAITISNMWCKEVERLLITELEKVEGRVPSNEEVQEFASCTISPDGTRHYQWKEKPMLVVKPWKLSESGQFTLDYLLPTA